MTNIDQFESVFKAADKPKFTLEPVPLSSVLVISGLANSESRPFDHRVRSFVASDDVDQPKWRLITSSQFSRVSELLARIDEERPDLICTYRNLLTPAPDLPYSLGSFVDVLTQATSIPVMLFPAPTEPGGEMLPLGPRDTVMAVTDHLTGDHHLVSYAAFFTARGGTLFLSHMEDDATFERYINTISKIPSIDTETARDTILVQLLKEPRDYIRSCREVLLQQNESLRVEEIVQLGHHLTEYKRMVSEHRIKLLVMNTKDQDQLAMHGLAYPLTIELRDIPLLLL